MCPPKTRLKANLKATFFSKDGEERLLAIVDRVAVDRDKTLMVVEFQGKYYLMSTTGQEIRLLDKVPAPETVVEHMEDIDEAEDSNGNPAASCDVEAAEPDSFWRRFADNFKMQAKERGDGFRKRFFKREWKKSEPGTFESELGKRIQQEEDAEGENGGRKEG
ncbi:MAG: flagellar biosynthetic protein FliO [Christensenellaceae bacterium]